MKLRFIFNPISGKFRRNAQLLPLLKDFVLARALDADVIPTEGPGHATELAKEAVAAGCMRIIAVGGDGTMNEVAQALLSTPVALGLVPCGSGNGLALHLGLPLAPAEALALAVSKSAQIAELDSGEANGRPFFNAMGIGLDAEVSRRFNQLKRRGLVAYARTATSVFFDRKMESCFVTCAGRREAIDAVMITVANSDQYGNRARIAPKARVDDGYLDLIAVRPIGAVAALVLGARLFAGSFDRSPHVRRLRGQQFLIERPSPGLFHTDGETSSGGTSIEVRVRPRSLRMVVPLNSPALFPTPQTAAGFALQLP